MKNELIEKAINSDVNPSDYYDENHILHCGVCHEAKEMILPQAEAMFNICRLPLKCACEREKYEQMQQREKQEKHERKVRFLREKCFRKKNMYQWNFENDHGFNSKMNIAREFVNRWSEEHTGLLLWGSVGTGKTFMAACIANALLEKEVSVHMTNFAVILNDLSSFSRNKNEYVDELCAFDLVIIDDLGMERTTDYGLEQIFNVIDNLSCSDTRLIVTTNMTLKGMKETTDLMYKRIFDRILVKCIPVMINDGNQREKMMALAKR